MKARDSIFTPRNVTEFRYPESDGKPLAETDEHRDIILHLIAALKLWFRSRPKVYVTGNIMLYWVEGDSNQKVSPDMFGVKGVESGDRRVYRTWVEGKGPTVVIEVTSLGTKGEDLGWKRELYQDVLRVKEYYLYDPLREYVPHRLRAWDRRGTRLVERQVSEGRTRSRELGLELIDVKGRLRLLDPASGRVLPDLLESEAARAQAEAAQTGAEAARTEAEAARTEAEAARIEAEAARTEAEAARTEAEAAQARVEEENRRLREEIDRLRRHGL